MNQQRHRPKTKIDRPRPVRDFAIQLFLNMYVVVSKTTKFTREGEKKMFQSKNERRLPSIDILINYYDSTVSPFGVWEFLRHLLDSFLLT